MKDNKNLFLVIGLVALLVVVAIVNYSISDNTVNNLDATNSDTQTDVDDDAIKSTDLQVPVLSTGDSILEYKAQRSDVRQKEVAYLDTIIENEKTEQEVLNEAQMQKIEITKNMEMELTVEGLIKAKGFADALVTVQANSVNVVVKTESLTDKQAAEILDIVKTETNQPSSNIKIMPQG
jgi:stage III sporulation protein AH